MGGAMFVVAFFGTLGAALSLARYAGVRLSTFSIPSLFLFGYVTFAHVGIVPLYFLWDERRVAIGVTDTITMLRMFAYSTVTILLVVGGFILAHLGLGLKAERPAGQAHCGRPATPAERIFFLMLFGASVAMLLRYLAAVPNVALLVALQSAGGDVTVARSGMGNDFEGSYWRYRLFFGPLLTFACVFFFTDYVWSRRARSGILFGLSFIVALFATLMAAEKAPVINLLLIIYIAHVMTRGGTYLQPALKYLLPLAVALMVGMYVLFMGAADAATGLQGAVSRLVTGGITPAYFYLQIFPQSVGFLHGTSFPNPGGLLPFEGYDLTREAMHYMYPDNYARGVVGSAPTVFWGEMYANFGTVGVLIAPLAVGVALYAVQHYLNRLRLSPAVVGATAVLAVHYVGLTGTSLSTYLIDTTLVAVLLTLVVALMIARAFVATPSTRQATGG